jgi:hypothetical protein
MKRVALSFCGFTAMLFGYKPLAYEDSIRVKQV